MIKELYLRIIGSVWKYTWIMAFALFLVVMTASMTLFIIVTGTILLSMNFTKDVENALVRYVEVMVVFVYLAE